MDFDATLDGCAIVRRFGGTLRRRHCFALDAFRVDRLPGESLANGLSSLLGDVLELLGRPRQSKLRSLSIFLENGVLRWAPDDLPVFGVYFGGIDGFYGGSVEEDVRQTLQGHSAYLASEAGTPDERAVLFGYYSPKGRIFYVAREVFHLVADRLVSSPFPGVWA